MRMERLFTGGPEFEHFRRELLRETREGRVPIIEPSVAPEIMAEVRGVDFPGGGYMMGSGNYVTTLRTMFNSLTRIVPTALDHSSLAAVPLNLPACLENRRSLILAVCSNHPRDGFLNK